MRLVVVCLVLVLTPFVMAPACGSSNAASFVGGTCTRTSDCEFPLECRGGTCRLVDAGIQDASDASDSSDSGDSGDSGDLGNLGDSGELDAETHD